MTSRHPLFLPYNRKPIADPNASVLTDAERADLDEKMRDGTTPRYRLVRKVMRLSDERKLTLDRIARVVDQARNMPGRYTAESLVAFIHNLLRGDDDMGDA